MYKLILLVSVISLGFLGCNSKKEIEETLNQHPEIITDVMEKHADLFAPAIQKVMMAGRAKMQERQMQAEKDKTENEFKNPLKPDLSNADDRGYFGDKSAPVIIVEYSDFQCPYCRQGYMTLESLRDKYKDKVAIFFKDHPLPMHPMAVPAAKRFEAIRIQDPKLALAFYKEVFENQAKLGSGGEKFLDEVAHKIKVNMKKMKADMELPKVKDIIDSDTAEAMKFGLPGTPGFVVNGVSLNGARDVNAFSGIIDRLLANNPPAAAK